MMLSYHKPHLCKHKKGFFKEEREGKIMSRTAQDIMKMIQDEGIAMVDFKIVDISGQFRHVTIPASQFNEDGRIFRKGI